MQFIRKDIEADTSKQLRYRAIVADTKFDPDTLLPDTERYEEDVVEDKVFPNPTQDPLIMRGQMFVKLTENDKPKLSKIREMSSIQARKNKITQMPGALNLDSSINLDKNGRLIPDTEEVSMSKMEQNFITLQVNYINAARLAKHIMKMYGNKFANSVNQYWEAGLKDTYVKLTTGANTNSVTNIDIIAKRIKQWLDLNVAVYAEASAKEMDLGELPDLVSVEPDDVVNGQTQLPPVPVAETGAAAAIRTDDATAQPVVQEEPVTKAPITLSQTIQAKTGTVAPSMTLDQVVLKKQADAATRKQLMLEEVAKAKALAFQAQLEADALVAAELARKTANVSDMSTQSVTQQQNANKAAFIEGKKLQYATSSLKALDAVTDNNQTIQRERFRKKEKNESIVEKTIANREKYESEKRRELLTEKRSSVVPNERRAMLDAAMAPEPRVESYPNYGDVYGVPETPEEEDVYDFTSVRDPYTQNKLENTQATGSYTILAPSEENEKWSVTSTRTDELWRAYINSGPTFSTGAPPKKKTVKPRLENEILHQSLVPAPTQELVVWKGKNKPMDDLNDAGTKKQRRKPPSAVVVAPSRELVVWKGKNKATDDSNEAKTKKQKLMLPRNEFEDYANTFTKKKAEKLMHEYDFHHANRVEFVGTDEDAQALIVTNPKRLGRSRVGTGLPLLAKYEKYLEILQGEIAAGNNNPVMERAIKKLQGKIAKLK